jgi:hypothetical protein
MADLVIRYANEPRQTSRQLGWDAMFTASRR